MDRAQAEDSNAVAVAVPSCVALEPNPEPPSTESSPVPDSETIGYEPGALALRINEQMAYIEYIVIQAMCGNGRAHQLMRLQGPEAPLPFDLTRIVVSYSFFRGSNIWKVITEYYGIDVYCSRCKAAFDFHCMVITDRKDPSYLTFCCLGGESATYKDDDDRWALSCGYGSSYDMHRFEVTKSCPAAKANVLQEGTRLCDGCIEDLVLDNVLEELESNRHLINFRHKSCRQVDRQIDR